MSGFTGIDTYLADISRYPLLTADEEIELGRQVQRMLQLKGLDRELTPQEKRAIRVGERAQEKFVRCNLKLVVSAAKRYMSYVKNMDLMDLVQEGNIGLIRGVEKFDPSRGYKFSTYAYWWIRQSINRAITTKERLIRLPGKAQEIASGWNVALRKLTQELDRLPTTKELAAHFKVTEEEVRYFMRVGMSPCVSLDQTLKEESSMLFVDLIEDPANPNGDNAMRDAVMDELYQQIDKAFFVLTEKEQAVLDRRWGLHGHEPETMLEISRTMDVSRERVRQVMEKAHKKIRYHLSASKGFSRKQLNDELAPPAAALPHAV